MQLNTVLDALILGVVEGVTEFIPVSSTAHLLLADRVLGFENAGNAFEVLIQFGAILALLSVYAGRLIRLVVELPRDRRTQRFALGVILAFIPSAILGVLFHRFITEVLFGSTILICVMLILGGIVLLFVDHLPIRPRQHDVMDYPLGLSLGIGLFQCLVADPRRLALGRDHRRRHAPGGRQAVGGGVLLLPRHADHARRLRLRPLQELGEHRHERRRR